MTVQRGNDWHKGQINEQDLIFRMIYDVGHLFTRQARVNCMAHCPHARDGVIQLKMPIPVPGQCRDTVARLHTKRAQGVGHLRHTL
jgi:hypothetical protein